VRSFFERQLDPEQSVALFGFYSRDVDRQRQLDDSLKWSVINFEGDHLHCASLVVGRFGRLARAANGEALRIDEEFNLRAIDAGEIDADAQSPIALESVDCQAASDRARAG